CRRPPRRYPTWPDDGGTGPTLQGGTQVDRRVASHPLRRLAARYGLRTDRLTLGDAVGQHAHSSYGLRLSRPVSAGRDQPIGGTRHHPAVRVVRRPLAGCPETLSTVA